MPDFDQRSAWNAVAARYQAQVAPDEPVVHYGPWAPDESELHLLGAVRGLRILEIGCGGGQSVIALAQRGATVTGLDISDEQIRLAQAQAKQLAVDVDWVVGDGAELAGFEQGAWDLILATYALPYITPLSSCLTGCQRLLRPAGRLVFSLDHPVRNLFFDSEEQGLVLYPVRSYFAERPLQWRFPGAERPMQTQHLTLTSWIDLIHGAGLQLVRLVEAQMPPAVANRQWPEGDPLFSMRNLPHTVIFVVRKPANVEPDGQVV